MGSGNSPKGGNTFLFQIPIELRTSFEFCHDLHARLTCTYDTSGRNANRCIEIQFSFNMDFDMVVVIAKMPLYQVLAAYASIDGFWHRIEHITI